MTPDLTFIKEKFECYNKMIFGGRLPEPRFRLCAVKTFLGKCSYQRRRRFPAREEFYDFQLKFNVRADLPEEEWEDVVIHEMIHYYIGWTHLKDRSAHGPVFRKMMDGINRKFNRHITISHRLPPAERCRLADRHPRRQVIAVVEFHRGAGGVKVLPPDRTKVEKYYQAVSTSPKVKSIRLYISDNPFFNQYPQSTALNVYRLAPDEAARQLENARPYPIG